MRFRYQIDQSESTSSLLNLVIKLKH